MHKLFGALLALAIFITPALAQPQQDQDQDRGQAPPAAKAPPGNGAPKPGANKAEGIEMPPDMKVNNDEGFVTLTATCKGPVKFLVISANKVKYISNDNTIVVSIPCTGGLITVFAIGTVDGKPTDFVSTNIVVGTTPGATPPGPVPPGTTPPGPVPPGTNPPAAVKGPYHVTFVLDLNQTTPQIAQVLNSQTLRKTITDAGNFFRIYDKTSPIVGQRGLDKVMAQVGGTNAMVVQTGDGAVVSATPIPSTEADVLATLRKVGGVP
jgi:hypothetical protein